MHDELRRHVKWSSEDKIKTSLLIEFLSKSKIGNLDVKVVWVFGHQENVLWLHVSMGDRLQVHVVESQHDLVDDVHSLALCEAGNLWKSLEKLTTFYKLRHNVVIVVVFDQVNDSDDVWVRFLP